VEEFNSQGNLANHQILKMKIINVTSQYLLIRMMKVLQTASIQNPIKNSHELMIMEIMEFYQKNNQKKLKFLKNLRYQRPCPIKLLRPWLFSSCFYCSCLRSALVKPMWTTISFMFRV